MSFKPVHIKQIHKILKKAGFDHAFNYEKAKRTGKSGYVLDTHQLKFGGIINVHHSIAYQYPVDWATNGNIMKEYALKYKETLEKEGIMCFITETSLHFPMLYIIAEESDKTPLYITYYLRDKKLSTYTENSTENQFQ